MAERPLPETLLALIESRGLTLAPGLDRRRLVTAGAAVHQLRRTQGFTGSGTVSRTSVLTALLIDDPGAAADLRELGFSSRLWTALVGVHIEDPRLVDGAVKASSDLSIRPRHWVPLIDDYRQRFGDRPVDRAALLYMVLSCRREGNLRGRLKEVGLDVEEARAWAVSRLADDLGERSVAPGRPQPEAARKGGGPRRKTAVKRHRRGSRSFEGSEAAGVAVEEESEPSAEAEGSAGTATDAGKAADAGTPQQETPPGPRPGVVSVPEDLGLGEELRDRLAEFWKKEPEVPLTPGGLLVVAAGEWWDLPPFREGVGEPIRIATEEYGNRLVSRWSGARLPEFPVTDEGLAVLQAAVEFCRRSTGLARAGPQHLLAVLLVHRSEDPLETSVFPLPPEAARVFFEFFEEQPAAAGEDLEAWSELLFGRGEPPPVAGFRAEDFGGPDRLGITRHVEAFSALIASRSLEPPLSIGLFGDWGSGKSFFMHKLQKEIERLAAEAENLRAANRASSLHGAIVQVTFNAWNYVEAELWASLVAHLFESLHQHFHPRGSAEKDDWLQLLSELDAVQESADAAASTLEQAEEELAAAREEQRQRESGWVAAAGRAWGALKEVPELAAPVAELERTLHAAEVGELRDQLFRGREELRATVRQAAVRRAGLRGLAGVPAIAAGLLAALLVVGGYLLAAQFFPAELAALSAGFARTLAAVGAGLAWLTTGLRKVGSVLDALGRVEQAVREGELPATERRLLERAEAAVERARGEVAERRRRVAALQERVEAARPGQRLSRFLAERAESTDYRKHLGLPALARRDFQTLQRLMLTRFTVRREELDAGGFEPGQVPEPVRRALREIDLPLPDEALLAAGGEPGSWRIEDPVHRRRIDLRPERRDGGGFEGWVERTDLPRIDRIVLYIDDLDRCPAERVVEVLEAVHLLLALPLFVVVVGVDARWVERALRKHHRDLWQRDDGDDPTSGPGRAAEPHDYLEKIFQVPFWLKPMDDAATRRFLREVMGGAAVDSHRGDGDGADAGTTVGEAGGEGSAEAGDDEEIAGQSRRGARAPREEGASEAVTEAARVDAGAASDPGDATPTLAAGAAAGPGSAAAEAPPEIDGRTAAANPRRLELSEAEVLFLERLAPVVGRSPRTVKRFVNVYRLLRASLPGWRLTSFLGGEGQPGDYRAAMLLLAVVVGCPAAARELFPRLETAPAETPLADLVAEIEVGGAASRQWQGCGQVLGAEGMPRTAGELAPWLGEVGRYSFRVGHGPTPAEKTPEN